MTTSFTRRLATAALSISILAAPVAVLAADTSSTTPQTSEIQAIKGQIKSLFEQIATLTKRLGTLTGHHEGDTASTTPSGAPCPVPPRNLGPGAHGDDVLSLQKFLAEDPTLLSSDSATGFFGPKTADAVKKFQAKNISSTTPTGFVGKLTREFLGKHCGDLLGHGHDMDHEHMGSSTDATSSPNHIEHGGRPDDHGGSGSH